jgi:hypothetical protein
LIVTTALGIDAPDGSLMKPEIVPRSDCATRTHEAVRVTKSAKTLERNGFFIVRSVLRKLASKCPGFFEGDVTGTYP